MHFSYFTVNLATLYIIILPEPNIQVHYCDHALSVDRPLSVVNCSYFHFFSETAERNSTKLDMKQDHIFVFFFFTNQKTIAAPASD